MVSMTLALLTVLPNRRAIAAGVVALLAPPAAVAAKPAPVLALPAPASSSADPIMAAIVAHRRAWAAFQIAPDDVASAAEDDEHEAAQRLLGTACTSRDGAVALVAHLGWYIGEEADNLLTAGLGGCHLGSQLRARLAELNLFLGLTPSIIVLPAPRGPSPLLAAIEEHRSANLALTQATADFVQAEEDGDPAEPMLLAAADRASDAEVAALNALTALTPADAGEVRTLVAYFAEVSADLDATAFGTWLLERLAAAVARA